MSANVLRVLRTIGSVTRKVAVEDLVGAAEIAARLGMRQNHTVHEWRKRYADFPAPIAELAMGHVWSWTEVARWAKRTGRL